MALTLRTTLAMALLVAVAGCSKPDPLDLKCPKTSVKITDANHTFMTRVDPGYTSAKPLNKLKGMVRQATLDKAGEAPLKVAFFQTAVRGCPWQVAQPAITPVVVKDGVIVSVGSDMLQGMIDDGWKIREAAWPWNNYRFGYIPAR